MKADCPFLFAVLIRQPYPKSRSPCLAVFAGFLLSQIHAMNLPPLPRKHQLAMSFVTCRRFRMMYNAATLNAGRFNSLFLAAFAGLPARISHISWLLNLRRELSAVYCWACNEYTIATSNETDLQSSSGIAALLRINLVENQWPFSPQPFSRRPPCSA